VKDSASSCGAQGAGSRWAKEAAAACCSTREREPAGAAAGRPAASVWEQARDRSRGCSRGPACRRSRGRVREEPGTLWVAAARSKRAPGKEHRRRVHLGWIHGGVVW